MNVVLNQNHERVCIINVPHEVWAANNPQASSTDIFVEDVSLPPEYMALPTMPDITTKVWVEGDQAAADAKVLVEKAAAIRGERDALLAACDYIVMPDYPLADKTNWLTYRQALRDVTLQATFPEQVTWPVKPI